MNAEETERMLMDILRRVDRLERLASANIKMRTDGPLAVGESAPPATWTQPEVPVAPHVCSKILGQLSEFRSWKLERLSPTTYAQDIGVRCPKARTMERELKGMLRSGQAFRCRIAGGEYFYARNIPDAVNDAIADAKARQSAPVQEPPA